MTSNLHQPLIRFIKFGDKILSHFSNLKTQNYFNKKSIYCEKEGFNYRKSFAALVVLVFMAKKTANRKKGGECISFFLPYLIQQLAKRRPICQYGIQNIQNIKNEENYSIYYFITYELHRGTLSRRFYYPPRIPKDISIPKDMST